MSNTKQKIHIAEVLVGSPELNDTFNLYCLTTFISTFLEKDPITKATFFTKDEIFNAYKDFLIDFNGASAVHKATFTYIFKIICAYYGYQLVIMGKQNSTFLIKPTVLVGSKTRIN